MKKIIPLLFLCFCSHQILAADCDDVSGTTVTISKSCTDLDIQGDNADVTINSGVTVSGSSAAVNSTGSGTITAITNNGTINVQEKQHS